MAMTIYNIESLNEETIKPYVKEHLIIKDHDCYLCDFGEYFGYSIVVFKNGYHIYYANDYALHHVSDNQEELRKCYIETMQRRLYTDAELLEECKSYKEYQLKEHFLRNYWIMRYDRLSIFGIGERAEKEFEEKKSEYPFYNSTCFCYVKDRKIAEDASKYIKHLQNEFKKLEDNEDEFRKMVRYELNNHESCITMDYRDALDALGLTYDALSDRKQKIVDQELNRQIQMYG